MADIDLRIVIDALNNASKELGGLTGELDKLTGAEQSHTQASKEGGAATQELKKGLGGMLETVTGLSLGELSLAGAMVGVVEIAKQSIDTTVRLGEATEKFQNLTGATAQEASQTIAVFNDLGISSDLVTRAFEAAVRKGYEPTIQGLQQMRAEYNALQDPIERSKWLMHTFGRSGAELAEYFKTGNDELQALAKHAEAAGVVMDEKGVESARSYAIATQELNDTWTGFKNRIGQAIIPALNDLANAVNKATLENDDYRAVVAGMDPVMANQMAMSNKYNHALDDLVKAYQDGKGAAEGYVGMAHQVTAATDTSKTSIDNVSASFKTLTADMLYQKEAAGLDAQTALDLAKHMGLVNDNTYAALKAVDAAKQHFADANVPLAEQESTLNAINAAYLYMSKLPKDLNFTVHVNQQGSFGGVPLSALDNVTEEKLKGGTGGTGRKGGVSEHALGGMVGPGEIVVGERGPERLRLNAGSSGQVINNYHTNNFQLSANYAFQSERSLRNDIRLMQMMRPR